MTGVKELVEQVKNIAVDLDIDSETGRQALAQIVDKAEPLMRLYIWKEIVFQAVGWLVLILICYWSFRALEHYIESQEVK